VITAARKVDSGIVDIERNELWERLRMQGVNWDRNLGKKTGGGLEKLCQELQAENEGVVVPLAINWIGGPNDVQSRRRKQRKHQRLCLWSRVVRWPKKFQREV